MNYEKAYKEVIESIKRIHNQADSYGKELMEKEFPELHELSETEMIEKLYRLLCAEVSIGVFEKYGLTDDAVFSWFEKQREHANFRNKIQVGDKVTRNEDGVLVNLSQLKRVAKPSEKQREQKPAEPKFKVGDWIVYYRNDSSREILYVYDIRDGRYYFNDNIHLYWSVKKCDEKCHLWTIQDAKDGDVLTYYLDNGKVLIMIYECLGKSFDGQVNCHALLDGDYFSESAGSACCKFMELLTPSTKEQCDLLFQKMHHSGYEWDAEKKELKKIDNTPNMTEALRTEYEKGRADAIAEIYKSAKWSEEDEKMLEEVCSNIEFAIIKRPTLSKELGEKQLNWLKSLKPQKH